MINLGHAEIRIELVDNCITVYHGECNSILETFRAKEGDWDKIWETIRSLNGEEND